MSTLRYFLLLALCLATVFSNAQRHVYDVELLGKKIGTTTVERIDKGKGEVQFKLSSSSEVNILFSHKTSLMSFDVTYKNGMLVSSYCKNVKDGITEVVTMAWEGGRYVIRKGEEILHMAQPLDFSSIQLYFLEPKGKPKIFSERLAQFCSFRKKEDGEYECKLSTGVNNIYRYRNGMLYELEMSKGASVFMRLVQ